MKPKFYRRVLSNGMTVFLEKRNLPIVSIALAVRSGGINDELSEKGISHFMEHMIYKGTASRSAKQIAEEIEKKGGDLNGFTGEILTAFWCKIPSKHIGPALNVLGDMVSNPLFDEKEINKERQVILEEIKMRRDNPHIYILDRIVQNLYGGSLSKDLIGEIKVVSSINRAQIINKFEKTYQPNNLILGVVGDADFEKIVKFAQNTFGNGKSQIPTAKISKRNVSKTEKRRGMDQANLVFAYHVPLSSDRKSYAAEILGTLMVGGMSSRLFTEIREKRNLAYTVKGDSEINRFFAHTQVYVGTPKKNVSLIKKLILEEFRKVADGLGEKELNSVKEQLIGNYKIYMEDSQNQLLNLLLHEIDGDAKRFYDFEKRIREVRLQDVKNLAKIKKYSFFALVPE